MHKSRQYMTYVIFLSFLILSPHITPVLSSFITPNEIRELFVNDQTNFHNEAANWVASPGKKTTYIWYLCDNTYVVGGYGVGTDSGGSQRNANSYWGRTYQGLAPHTMIFFSFQLWAIDSWDIGDNDGFSIYFNGVTIAGFPLDLWTFGPDRCGVVGNDWREAIMTVQGRVQHISSTLEFRIYSLLSEPSDNESLGIREVNFVMSNGAVQSNMICSPNTPNTSYRCPNSCPDGTYSNGVGCPSCHPNCAKCYAYGIDKCYSCASGIVYDGSQCVSCHPYCATCYGGASNQCLTCSSTAPYMYNKNTCLTACADPLAIRSGNVCELPCPENQYLYPASASSCYVECKFPLEAYTTSTPIGVVNRCRSPCDVPKYMYWEASCRLNCDFPLQAETTSLGIKHCKFPCPSQTQILYWNGDCSSTCDFPLDYANRFNRAFCDYPCLDTQFLYNNGSCAGTCRQWFRTDLVTPTRGKQFCYYPCQPAEHLYNNGACLAECDWRFRNYTLWKDQHCDYPCTSSEYLYTNGSCIGSCDPRFGLRIDAVTGDKYCDYPCTKATQYLFSNGSCAENCDHLFSPYYLWDEMYCDYPCQSNQHLLNNGTCVNNCNTDYPHFNPFSTSGLPLRNGAIVVEKYCFYPCPPNEYLYGNGTCHSHCQRHYVPNIYSRDKFCNYPCQSTENLYQNGSCLTNCPSIFNSYYFTPPASEKYCANPCNEPDFIYPNGTCIASCLPPYVQQIYGADSFCIYPCSTTTVEYLYRDGSCKPSCLSYYSSRTEGNKHFCDYPCEPDHFLYYNHTCLSSCKLPFVLRVVNQENFCDHPCATTSDFIYWNGTCQSTCSAPLEPLYEGTTKLCIYHCTADQFLTWTGICLDNCPFPLTATTTTDGRKYCNNPCSSSQYLSWNGTCLSQCLEPFRIEDNGLGLRCELPCEDSEYYYYEDTKECKPTCDESPTLEQGIYLVCRSSSASIAVLEFLSTPPTEPNTITYIMLANPIKYLRYLNVKMSPRLERLALSQGKAPISLLYIRGIPSEIGNLFSQSVRTRLLAQVDVPANFLVNFWPEILTLAILLFVALIFAIAEALSKKLGLEEVRVILERIKVVVRWNIPVMVLATSFGNVILYSSFEFQMLNLDSVASYISFILCILFIIAEAGILILGYCVAPKAHGLKVNSLKTRSFKDYSEFLYKWQGIQIMYNGFTTQNKLSYYFFLFYTIRMAAPMLIAAYIPNPPLLQTILFLVISLVSLFYLSFVKPLRKKITRVQFLLSEIFMLVINIGLLALTILDIIEETSGDAIIIIGDVIIVLSFCLCIMPTVFLIIKMGYGGLVAYRLRKVSPEQSEAMLVQLIFLPIQQAGMGYEQVQIARHSEKYSKISSLDTTRLEKSVDKEESSTPQEGSPQTHLFNSKNPAKRMRVPEIFKSNIKQQSHEKDHNPEYRTFAAKSGDETQREQSLDPFSVTDELPRKKRMDKNIVVTGMQYANVYAATKGFGRVDDL